MKPIIPNGEWRYTLKELDHSTLSIMYRKEKREKPNQPEILFKSVSYLDVRKAWIGEQFADRTEDYQQFLTRLGLHTTHKVYVSQASIGPDMKIVATGYELLPSTP